jgi:hypothetical protein
MEKIHNHHIEEIIQSLIKLDNNWLGMLRSMGNKMNDIQSIIADYDMDGDAEGAMEKLKELFNWEDQSKQNTNTERFQNDNPEQ